MSSFQWPQCLQQVRPRSPNLQRIFPKPCKFLKAGNLALIIAISKMLPAHTKPQRKVHFLTKPFKTHVPNLNSNFHNRSYTFCPNYPQGDQQGYSKQRAQSMQIEYRSLPHLSGEVSLWTPNHQSGHPWYRNGTMLEVPAPGSNKNLCIHGTTTSPAIPTMHAFLPVRPVLPIIPPLIPASSGKLASCTNHM